MPARLSPVIAWLKERGGPRAFDRVRLKMLSRTLREKVNLDRMDPTTEVSRAYYEAFVDAASEVVGERFGRHPLSSPRL